MTERLAHRRTLALAVGLPLLLLFLLGNDANWDLQNYHLYNPHAWMHGRAAIDVAPAQWQSYHSPYLDLPMYLLAQAGAHPKLIGLWLALPTMLSLGLLLRLQARLSPQPPTAGAQMLLAALALLGAATWSTFALSMNDAFVGAAILASLALVLGEARATEARRWLCAGLLAGGVTGLKMTAGVYCVALAVVAFPGGPWGARARRLAALGLGGAAGFLLAYAPWAWELWREHGNPFFPYFNDWFHSPDALPIAYMDGRFRPGDWLDLLLVPVHLLQRSLRFSEDGLRDPRLLLGLLGFAWLAWRARGDEARAGALARLALFFFVALPLWAWQSGIYRYAIVLELLGVLALLLCLQPLPKGARLAAMAAALLVVGGGTVRPDWHRVHSSAPPLPTLAQPLPADALVVSASGEPIGYIALALPDSVQMLGLANNLMVPGQCTRLRLRAERALLSHRGPVYLATGEHDSEPPAQALLRQHYGFAASGACVAVRATIASARLCPQARVAPAAGACPGALR